MKQECTNVVWCVFVCGVLCIYLQWMFCSSYTVRKIFMTTLAVVEPFSMSFRKYWIFNCSDCKVYVSSKDRTDGSSSGCSKVLTRTSDDKTKKKKIKLAGIVQNSMSDPYFTNSNEKYQINFHFKTINTAPERMSLSVQAFIYERICFAYLKPDRVFWHSFVVCLCFGPKFVH